jgi:hypothetical protein
VVVSGDLEERSIEWLEFDKSREQEGHIGFGDLVSDRPGAGVEPGA